MNDADRSAALLRVVLGDVGPVAPDAGTWNQWIQIAAHERVSPLLFHLLDRVPTDLSDEQRQQARALQGGAMARGVRFEHHLIDVTRLLGGAGLACVALKGSATAHLDYPDPSWREVGDIDVLIDPIDRPRVIGLLEADRWRQGYALPRGHEEFTHAVTFVRDGVELDLHQRVAHRALGLLVPTDDLLERSVSFDVAGEQLRALEDTDRLLHAALHAATSRDLYRRLSSQADVLVLARRQVRAASDAVRRAEQYRVRSIFERALFEAHAVARVELDSRWNDALRAPGGRRDRLVDWAYGGDDRRPLLEELAYLRRLDRWPRRWRYARGYFSTSPDYAAQHGRSGARAQARYVLEKLRSRSET